MGKFFVGLVRIVFVGVVVGLSGIRGESRGEGKPKPMTKKEREDKRKRKKQRRLEKQQFG